LLEHEDGGGPEEKGVSSHSNSSSRINFAELLVAGVLPCRLLCLLVTSFVTKGFLKLKEIQQLSHFAIANMAVLDTGSWQEPHQAPINVISNAINAKGCLFFIIICQNEGTRRQCEVFVRWCQKTFMQSFSTYHSKLAFFQTLTTLSKARTLPPDVWTSNERPRPLSSMPTISTSGSSG
jgi:hypothetical protein